MFGFRPVISYVQNVIFLPYTCWSNVGIYQESRVLFIVFRRKTNGDHCLSPFDFAGAKYGRFSLNRAKLAKQLERKHFRSTRAE